MKAGDSIGYFPVRNEIRAPPTIASKYKVNHQVEVVGTDY